MKIQKSITNFYNKMSNVGKILLFISLLLILVVFFKKIQIKEGYEQNDKFLFKTGVDLYDEFYSDIYDYLVFNNLKDDYEVGAIVNNTKPTEESIILDIGSGTGHHVSKLSEQGLNVLGIDISQSMVKKAKENFPQYRFEHGDAIDHSRFNNNSFTHILCLYFTIYYMKDKQAFFYNCMDWLMPGGFLIIHLVERDRFDPILPPGNPLYIVSPQKYAKERITKTKVIFNDFEYTSNFNIEPLTDTNIALFDEKFKFKNGKVRKQEHKLYMEPHEDILVMAQNAGFIIQGIVDLIKCAYENQYLYILVKA